MGPGEAIQSALSRYATFSGRAGRAEYWWFMGFYLLVAFGAAFFDGLLLQGEPVFYLLSMLGLLVPALAVTSRRLHDVGHSGWMQLLFMIPMAGFVVWLVFTVRDSDVPNKFGHGPGLPGWETHEQAMAAEQAKLRGRAGPFGVYQQPGYGPGAWPAPGYGPGAWPAPGYGYAPTQPAQQYAPPPPPPPPPGWAMPPQGQVPPPPPPGWSTPQPGGPVPPPSPGTTEPPRYPTYPTEQPPPAP